MIDLENQFKAIGRRVRNRALPKPATEATSRFQSELHGLRSALGRLETHNRKNVAPENLKDSEFQVYSQWNEDGIIQHLLHHIAIEEDSFIEIGVEDYQEANTRFLLVNDNWRGLIVDANRKAIEQVTAQKSLLYRYDLQVRAASVTCENINDIVTGEGFEGDIGLLSIDVDGNDYWLWKSITAVSPRIVVIEYNSVLGAETTVTVPYDPAFSIWTAHRSLLYFGASLSALCVLAKQKGYKFVGCESHGCNAFFIREDLAPNLPALTAQEGYILSRFRYGQDVDGWVPVSNNRERLSLMADARYEDILTGQVRTVAEIYSLL